MSRRLRQVPRVFQGTFEDLIDGKARPAVVEILAKLRRRARFDTFSRGREIGVGRKCLDLRRLFDGYHNRVGHHRRIVEQGK
jgi:hypothetical protein